MDVDSPLPVVDFLTEKDAKFKKPTNKRKRVGNRIRIGEKIAKIPRTNVSRKEVVEQLERAEKMAEESLEGMFNLTTSHTMAWYRSQNKRVLIFEFHNSSSDFSLEFLANL